MRRAFRENNVNVPEEMRSTPEMVQKCCAYCGAMDGSEGPDGTMVDLGKCTGCYSVRYCKGKGCQVRCLQRTTRPTLCLARPDFHQRNPTATPIVTPPGQAAAWKTHKKECKKIQRERKAAAGAADVEGAT